MFERIIILLVLIFGMFFALFSQRTVVSGTMVDPALSVASSSVNRGTDL